MEKKSTTIVKKTTVKTIKEPTLLEAMEHVAELSRNSRMSNDFYVKALTDIKFISESYGITLRQAVLFCVCRDCYDFPDNMSQFERVIVSLPFTRELSYICNEGTISNALNASPYMKLHIDKWATNGAKERVLALRDKFINAIDSAREEK